MRQRKSAADRIVEVAIHGAIVLLCLSILYPIFYVVMNSLNPDIMYGPALLVPKRLTWYYYATVFKTPLLVNSFFISVARTVLGAASCVFICSMCAFALRKKHLRLRRTYLGLFLVPMFFGGGLIPYYLTLKRLGLIDNFLVYILPQAFSFVFVILLMSFFNEIPDSLEDSAKIDGANYFLIFARIYFPVSLPVMAVIALFSGVDQWNAWFDTLYYTSSRSLMTLSAVLLRVIQGAGMEEMWLRMSRVRGVRVEDPRGIQLATMVVAIAPIVAIYPLLQRYFIKGIMIGALKY